MPGTRTSSARLQLPPLLDRGPFKFRAFQILFFNIPLTCIQQMTSYKRSGNCQVCSVDPDRTFPS
ncbi:hypothetical protein RSAG8_04870, partial [Rhizoctonia solani AG-8 WAC10335]